MEERMSKKQATSLATEVQLARETVLPQVNVATAEELASIGFKSGQSTRSVCSLLLTAHSAPTALLSFPPVTSVLSIGTHLLRGNLVCEGLVSDALG